MVKQNDNLISGEKVVFKAKYHWIILSFPMVLTFFGLCIGFLSLISYTQRQQNEIWPCFLCSALWLVVALYYTVMTIVANLTSDLTLTNRRVIIKSGVIRRRTQEIILTQIETIDLEQSPVGRFFDYGSIVITGTGGAKQNFKYIANASKLVKQIQSQIAKSN